MNRLLIGSLTFVFATTLLAAQTPAPTGKDPDRINRRAKQMRDQLGTGKQVKSHVRVQVRLKNGNRLTGVVKDGRLVERVTGLRFVDAHAADKGAGIRLWYSGGMRNYVFVPFADLNTYNVLQRLTAKQLEEIEAELMMQEVKRDEQLRKEIEEREKKAGQLPPGAVPGSETDPAARGKPAAGSGDKDKADSKTGKVGGKPASEGEDAAQETQRKWFKLLQDYPPNGGWNAEKRDEIARRFTVIGARPSASEQRFVDEFDEWKRACAHFGIVVKQDPDPQGGSEKGRGRRDRRKS